MRMALGAARSRLIRQMLTESVLLGFLGGLAGLAVAYAGTRTILALQFPGSANTAIDVTPSLPVLGFAFVASVLNLITPSAMERMIWAPVALALFVTSLRVALSR